MKNKLIKSPAELQKHVDYIIELSNITDYSENGTIKEEAHINVDLILAEPLSVLKKQKQDKQQYAKHLTPQGGHVSERYHSHTPAMPRRENLIAHGHYNVAEKVTLADIIYSLFRPVSYMTK